MRLFAFVSLYLPAIVIAQVFQPDGTAFRSPVTVLPGLSASVIFSNLTNPRGITIDSQHNVLVVEPGVGVSAFSRVVTPSAGWERTIVVANDAFTHGIQLDGKSLYVSTASDVLMYSYDSTTKLASTTPTTIITGLPADGDLLTHTLELVHGDIGNVTGLLVGSGPKTNIDITARDPASGRSQIRLFPLDSLQPIPLQWTNGILIAYGIRNPAGFTFANDPAVGPADEKTLLVVENGASIDNVTGITAAFANDNPADEVERFVYSLAGRLYPPAFFGFPDCTTLWNPRADPTGDPQYTNLTRGAQFSLNLPIISPVEPVRNDAWCQNETNNRPPTFNFQAHSVPLDIKQYQPVTTGDSSGFPQAWAQDIFVSFHGSFDRKPPTGYGIVHVPYPFNSASTTSDLGYTFLIQTANLSSCPVDCLRPVGLAFGKDNHLYASSDASGELFLLKTTSIESAI